MLFSVTSSALAADKPRVVMQTTLGELVIELEPERAPRTVENFLAYVDAGFYDDTVFHRIIDGFMAQGGGYTADLNRKPTGDPIANEADNGLPNVAGSIAMARTSNPHSATSQFFINLVDNPNLDHRDQGAGWGYCVFGRVVAGAATLQQMAAAPTGAAGPFRSDVPRETIAIISARRQVQP